MTAPVVATLLLLLAISPSVAETIPSEVTWAYRCDAPPANWFAADYQDADWQRGQGGFGTKGTPNSRVGTVWESNDIYLRREFELKEIPQRPALLIHHDEDAEVFLNGQLAAKLNRYSTKYEVVPLTDDAAKLLTTGKNLLAIHCHQTTGGQFIDAYVIDADKIPELPALPEPTTPYRSNLITRWGEAITPENAWREYPRPQMVRSNWQNLNGQWDYAVASQAAPQPTNWDGKILVPFCLESHLSGVQRLLRTTEALWYHRTIIVDSTQAVRTLLHFEAVDYRCTIWVNGQQVGTHVGGNLPFSFDITDSVRAGQNEIVVRVEDRTGGAQLRGKQTLDPSGIWYTRVSGIWQTVWLEQVPVRYINEIDVASDINAGSITVTPTLGGSEVNNVNSQFKVVVRDHGQVVAEGTAHDAVTLKIPNAKLWSPASPQLYDLEISLLDTTGQPIDSVTSYAAIRAVGKAKDVDGNLRMTLNGQPVFHLGPLDQGWWPDGLLTPPSDAAIQFELQWLK
ncbi:MAG: glycoside hydrolase family 2, partial [Planctomycetales bacterium]|nr:glycoside hydrolase family 2 [Planctomycetales bacterium]